MKHSMNIWNNKKAQQLVTFLKWILWGGFFLIVLVGINYLLNTSGVIE